MYPYQQLIKKVYLLSAEQQFFRNQGACAEADEPRVRILYNTRLRQYENANRV